MMKKRGLSKRILAFVLSVMMVLALVPVNSLTVYADDDTCEHCGGTGFVCEAHDLKMECEGDNAEHCQYGACVELDGKCTTTDHRNADLDFQCRYCEGFGIKSANHEHKYSSYDYDEVYSDPSTGVYCHKSVCDIDGCDKTDTGYCDPIGGICSVCGHILPLTHTHSKDETRHHEAKEASCIDGNIEYWECSCGKKIDSSLNEITDVTISATGIHDFSTQPYINDGSGKHYQECKVCGAKSTSEAHSGGTATCTAKATCEKCGVIYGETGAHSFTNYVSDNNATCTADGTETAKCDNCDATDTRTKEGSKKPHSFISYVSNNNATCTADGTETATCNNCDATDTRTKEGSKKPHSFTNYVSNNDATCTADGTETAICNNCDATDTRTASGSKLGHSWSSWSNGTRSCTRTGCNETDTHTSHTGGTATCTTKAVCGTCGASYGEFADHSYSSYVSNGDAKCLVDGTEKATCTVCGHENTRTEVNSALGHSWGAYSNGTRSCTRPGCDATDIHTSHTGGTATCTTKAVCGTCGASYGELAAHSFTNYISDNNATCTADGTKTAKCDNCTVTDTKTDTGSKKSHSFTNYVSNNDATCTADGTKTAKCDNCTETDTVTETGTKLSHKYGAWNDGKRKCLNCSSTETCKHSSVVSDKCVKCGKTFKTEDAKKDETSNQTETVANIVVVETQREVVAVNTKESAAKFGSAQVGLSTSYDLSSYTTYAGVKAGLSKIVTKEARQNVQPVKNNTRRRNTPVASVGIYTKTAIPFDRDMATVCSNLNVNLVYVFKHEGHTYQVTIPAGTDLTKIIEKGGYSGPLYIGHRLGTTRVIK